MQKSNLSMSKIGGISKSLKIEIVGLDNFLFPKIKKNQKNLKRIKLISTFFLKCVKCKTLNLCEFIFFSNFNLNWIDWSGTDNLIIHSNIFSLLILYRLSWSQHPLFSKRFLV